MPHQPTGKVNTGGGLPYPETDWLRLAKMRLAQAKQSVGFVFSNLHSAATPRSAGFEFALFHLRVIMSAWQCQLFGSVRCAAVRPSSCIHNPAGRNLGTCDRPRRRAGCHTVFTPSNTNLALGALHLQQLGDAGRSLVIS